MLVRLATKASRQSRRGSLWSRTKEWRLSRMKGNMEHKTDFLGREAIFPLLLKMGIPAAVGMIVNALYNIVDTIFVG